MFKYQHILLEYLTKCQKKVTVFKKYIMANRNIVSKFEGEILDVPSNFENSDEGKKFIGEMSDSAKKLYTLYLRGIQTKGELIESVVSVNPYNQSSEHKAELAVKLFEQVATFQQRQRARRIGANTKSIYKLLENQIYADFTKYKNHKFVFGKGWKIYDAGERRRSFYVGWERKEV